MALIVCAVMATDYLVNIVLLNTPNAYTPVSTLLIALVVVGTVLLMTSAQPQALLPTIRSRAQTIELLKPPLSQLTPHASAHQLKLSDGLPEIGRAHV